MKKIIVLSIVFTTLLGCNLFKSSDKLELIPYLEKDKYGYFDLEGKIAINPQFSEASAFREDLALVKLSNDNGEEGKWGFIDMKGKMVINAIYKSATVFQEGIAWVISDNSSPSAIDKSGEIKFTMKDAQEVKLFSDGLAAFSVVDTTSVTKVKWGFVNKSGNQEINPQFQIVGRFKEGKCAVANKEGKWGYIDNTGKIIINYQFDNASEFVDGKAVVSLNRKDGVIDAKGTYIINPQFNAAKVDGDLFIIAQDSKIGWCDKDAKFVINPQFEDGQTFKGSKLACIKSAGKWGYVDKEGKININPQFDKAWSFIGKVAVVNLGGKYGLIDQEGKYKVNPQFDNISNDLFKLFDDQSEFDMVMTDYLDVESIINAASIDKLPEGINYNDNYNSIISKLKISGDNYYGDEQEVITNKKINNNAAYSFTIFGNMRMMDPNTYEYVVSNEKPTGFLYTINLSGNAYGKAESVIKAYEVKLSGSKLIKKGYYKGYYTSIYKNGLGQQIVLSCNNSNKPAVLIYNNAIDLSDVLRQITDSKDTPEIEEYQEPEYDLTAPAVADTVAVDSYYGD